MGVLYFYRVEKQSFIYNTNQPVWIYNNFIAFIIYNNKSLVTYSKFINIGKNYVISIVIWQIKMLK